jgi:GT2 family glycosyltransferase
MDEHPGAGAVGVKMLDGHGAFLPESKRSFPTPWASFCKLFGLAKLFPGDPRFVRYNLLHLSPAETHEVEVLAGAFMLIRRGALEKTGGLDESFFMYGEDIDLSYRLVLSGYSNYYLPLRILHYKGESSKQGDVRYIRNFYGAMVIFFRKYYPRSGWSMSFLIRLAIRLKEWQARLRLPHKAADSLPVTGRRLLIACRGEVFPQLEKLCRESIPGVHTVEWKGRAKQQAGTYTDVVFSHPCLGFREMLRRMDEESNKKITYHIYTAASGRLVSPTK